MRRPNRFALLLVVLTTACSAGTPSTAGQATRARPFQGLLIKKVTLALSHSRTPKPACPPRGWS